MFKSIIFKNISARAESALEKQLKEEEKILESVAEKRGTHFFTFTYASTEAKKIQNFL